MDTSTPATRSPGDGGRFNVLDERVCGRCRHLEGNHLAAAPGACANEGCPCGGFVPWPLDADAVALMGAAPGPEQEAADRLMRLMVKARDVERAAAVRLLRRRARDWSYRTGREAFVRTFELEAAAELIERGEHRTGGR